MGPAIGSGEEAEGNCERYREVAYLECQLVGVHLLTLGGKLLLHLQIATWRPSDKETR
jgi:hypothetical protein